MTRHKILVIEDDADIQELIRYNLEREGYSVIASLTGEEGLTLAKKESPDLIVLDLMLPGMDGLDVCRSIKASPETKSVAIVMLTAKGEESDIVIGLELGADDYVTKPFSPKVLIARIKAVLRRKAEGYDDFKTSEKGIIKAHSIHIHPGRHEVKISGKLVDLTATEFTLLSFLASRPGWVFTRHQIIDAIHGGEIVVTDRAVDVQIVGLRKKLGDAGKYIETVRGVGYRFKD